MIRKTYGFHTDLFNQTNKNSQNKPATKNNFQNNRLPFGKATVNFSMWSDAHGKIDSISSLYDIMKFHKKIFMPEGKDQHNIGLDGGDWFMAPTDGRLITRKDKTVGDLQMEAMNLLYKKFTDVDPKFKMYMVPGNHCFDGGDFLLANYYRQLAKGIKVVLTNCNLNKSNALWFKKDQNQQLIPLTPKEKTLTRRKIRNIEVIKVPDDKDKNLIHRILLLGLTQPGVGFYNPGLVEDMDITNKTKNKDVNIKENDLKETYDELNHVIKNFKDTYPKGVVVVASHNGIDIAEMLVRNVKDIDVILNGHDHEDKNHYVPVMDNGKPVFDKDGNKKEVHIISLWEDCKKIDHLGIKFDDDGNWDGKSEINSHYISKTPHLHYNPLSTFERLNFSEDKKPLYRVVDKYNANYFRIEKNKDGKEIKLLSKTDIDEKGEEDNYGVRKRNNPLINFINDNIFYTIKSIDPDVEIWGMASSAVRKDFPVADSFKLPNKPKDDNSVNNLMMNDIIAGQGNAISMINTVNVTGKEMARIVVENLADHQKSEKRNSMIQWYGLQINKTQLYNFIKRTVDKMDDTFDKKITSELKTLNPKLQDLYEKDINVPLEDLKKKEEFDVFKKLLESDEKIDAALKEQTDKSGNISHKRFQRLTRYVLLQEPEKTLQKNLIMGKDVKSIAKVLDDTNYVSEKEFNELTKFIKVKDKDVKSDKFDKDPMAHYHDLKLKREYKLALPNYFFEREKVDYIQKEMDRNRFKKMVLNEDKHLSGGIKIEKGTELNMNDALRIAMDERFKKNALFVPNPADVRVIIEKKEPNAIKSDK